MSKKSGCSEERFLVSISPTVYPQIVGPVVRNHGKGFRNENCTADGRQYRIEPETSSIVVLYRLWLRVVEIWEFQKKNITRPAAGGKF